MPGPKTPEEGVDPNGASEEGGGADEAKLIRAAFGAANRNRLIGQFLDASADPAWVSIYKLILWTDKTTGLAHCYESDKCQPGKNWHARNLRFHDWLAASLGCEPGEVVGNIDWLFRRVADDYANYMVQRYQQLLERAAQQRAPYVGRGFPEPGDDPEIVALIRQELREHLTGTPTPDQWRTLAIKIRDLISVENKRKNIVGEGFEDALANIIARADGQDRLKLFTRSILHDIPGFANRRAHEKPVKVDLALVRATDQHRIMVTAKWSTRADREEQIRTDHQKYIAAESLSDTFEYVMVTNEFDPARLKRACEWTSGNSKMLHRVVHISPAALRAVYGDRPETTMSDVIRYIDSGRIVSIDHWIDELLASPPAASSRVG
ncbi:hypothetical protein KAK06_10235 [Ideonella sp. 4Y11]|uniref:Restriction endonuclease n=1 Tax=Ideonella aquatica TaxID=2824119 RepID=A0A940YIH2_9BURK|nr:hypothetical protein [Ideonella aquatica]MBQ0959327.1 hypothetical protein [Ideonella aquatica]